MLVYNHLLGVAKQIALAVPTGIAKVVIINETDAAALGKPNPVLQSSSSTRERPGNLRNGSKGIRRASGKRRW